MGISVIQFQFISVYWLPHIHKYNINLLNINEAK